MTIVTEKRCPKCGEIKPIDQFYRMRKGQDKRHARCIVCMKVDNGINWRKHKEKRQEYNRKYYIDNYAACRAYQSAQWKVYIANEEVRNRRNENRRVRYATKTKERERARNNRYMVIWRQSEHGKDLHRINMRARAAKKRQLPCTLTLSQWKCILRLYDYKCAYCGSSPHQLHQDHVIPVSSGGSYTFDNIVPACKSCNSSKGSKLLYDWLLTERTPWARMAKM